MMRRRSLPQIDDSSSRRRRVTLQQRTSISALGGSPSIDLIDIIPGANWIADIMRLVGNDDATRRLEGLR
jgi:hypothetical protein